MPTVKPRITITLSDEHHATLQALAHLQGVSMSSIVVDLLDTTHPVLQRLVAVLHNAAEAPRAVLEGLSASLGVALADTRVLGDAAMSKFDSVVDASLGGGAGAAALAGVPAPSSKSRPPSSNRGVRNVPPRSKNQPISSAQSGTYVHSKGRVKK